MGAGRDWGEGYAVCPCSSVVETWLHFGPTPFAPSKLRAFVCTVKDYEMGLSRCSIFNCRQGKLLRKVGDSWKLVC